MIGSFTSVAVSGFADRTFTLTYDRVNGDAVLNPIPVRESGPMSLFAAGLGVLANLFGKRSQLMQRRDGPTSA